MSIINNHLLTEFNTPSTLVMISSFPEAKREVAADNAVARYSHLLAAHFPTHQKVVIISERRSNREVPYLLRPHVLIVPTFKPNSITLFKSILEMVNVFSASTQVLIQHEMSVFGNQGLTFGLNALFATFKSQDKKVSVMLHQVVSDIADLAGHVGVKPGSIKAKALNLALKAFYLTLGKSVDQVLVHDSLLKKKFKALSPSAKVLVIPHGILPEKVISAAEQSKARKALGYKPTETVILAYGYQSWYKGTDWVIENVAEYARQNPKQKIKLIVAGSSSPTQKDSPSYQVFYSKLKKLLKKNRDLVQALGFVPEKKVRSIFAAADVVVFPYRARMSASGALSLAWQYQKPFLVSKHVAENLKERDAHQALKKVGLQADDCNFELSQHSFAAALDQVVKKVRLAQKLGRVGGIITTTRSWSHIAEKYAKACTLVVPKTRMKTTKLNSLSVFFPMHNEQDNVERVVNQALVHLPKIAQTFEIIIVNDGSRDKTSAIAHRLACKHRTIKVIDQPNLGYGGALRSGFEAAQYDWVFFSDGDLQFDLSELTLFLPQTESHRVVIGYRKHRADSTKRIVLASLLKLWNWIFFQFPTEVKDTDCAFKLFHRSVIKDVFPLQSRGAMISTELLLKITDQGYPVSQVGVTHYPRLFGEQTGAQAHVIIGAVKETSKLFYSRSLAPTLYAIAEFRWASLPAAVILFLYSVIQPKN